MSISETTTAGAFLASQIYTPRTAQSNESASYSFGSAEKRIPEDKVEISELGLRMSRLLDSLPPINGVKPRPDGSISLEDIRAHLEEKIAGLRKDMGGKFADAGIDTSRPMDLTADEEGNIRVSNDHPDKDKIEAIFANDPELANEARFVLATESLVRAADKHVEFAKAYDENPEAAIAKYGVGGSDPKSELFLRFTSGGLSVLEHLSGNSVV